MKDTITILSIDPGVNSCGLSIIELNRDDSIKLLKVETLYPEKLIHLYKDIDFIHGPRFTKVSIITKYIFNLLLDYEVDKVVSEMGYYNPKRPGAFAALIEIISAIRYTVFSYSNSTTFDVIDPSSIKNAVSVGGGSSDKNDMKTAILNYKNIEYNNIEISNLDEHSIDSIAVGIAFSKRLNDV